MVERIRIQDAKTANTPLGYHMKLSVKQYSQTKEKKKIMEITPCVVELEAFNEYVTLHTRRG